jgi:hypothetical protein
MGIRSLFARLFPPLSPMPRIQDPLFGDLVFDEWGWIGESTPFLNAGIISVFVPGGPDGPTAEGREKFRRIQDQFAALDQRVRATFAESFGRVVDAKLTAIDLCNPPHEPPRDFAFTYDIGHDWIVEFKDGRCSAATPMADRGQAQGCHGRAGAVRIGRRRGKPAGHCLRGDTRAVSRCEAHGRAKPRPWHPESMRPYPHRAQAPKLFPGRGSLCPSANISGNLVPPRIPSRVRTGTCLTARPSGGTTTRATPTP